MADLTMSQVAQLEKYVLETYSCNNGKRGLQPEDLNEAFAKLATLDDDNVANDDATHDPKLKMLFDHYKKNPDTKMLLILGKIRNTRWGIFNVRFAWTTKFRLVITAIDKFDKSNGGILKVNKGNYQLEEGQQKKFMPLRSIGSVDIAADNLLNSFQLDLLKSHLIETLNGQRDKKSKKFHSFSRDDIIIQVRRANHLKDGSKRLIHVYTIHFTPPKCKKGKKGPGVC